MFMDFMVQGTIMEAEALTVRADATPPGPMVPRLHHPPFLRRIPSAAALPICPGLGQAPNYAGLHTQWLGNQQIINDDSTLCAS